MMQRQEAVNSASARRTAWDQVRAWPALRGEPKLAWFALWSMADHRLGATLVVTAAAIGADQGTSDRGGLRALEALAAHGLVHVIDRYRGRWTVELRDPSEVARARRRVECDSQTRLPLDEQELAEGPQSYRDGFGSRLAEETPAETVLLLRAASADVATTADVAPHPPPETLESQKVFNPTLDFRPSVVFTQKGQESQGFGGSGATSAASSSAPRTATNPFSTADVVRSLLDPRRDDDERAKIAAEIRAAVKDERLRASVIDRVAAAVVDRRFSRAELRGIFERMRTLRAEGKLRCPWLFFVSAAKRRFSELRIEWPSKGDGVE